jgi:hypothetical protein
MAKTKLTKAQRETLGVIGSIGGSKKSAAKTAAAKRNIAKRWANNSKTP